MITLLPSNGFSSNLWQKENDSISVDSVTIKNETVGVNANTDTEKPLDEWRVEGLRIGLDLSHFYLALLQPVKGWGWEVSADFPYKRKFFPTVEMGAQFIDDTPTGNFHYKNNGFFGRLGCDVSIVKFASASDHDILYAGARYGLSVFNQEATDITIVDPAQHSIFGDYTTGTVPKQGSNAHWLEAVVGMKVEVLKNFSLGWSLRFKLLALCTDKGMKAYYIPGFGFRESEMPFDINYGIYYTIPMKKVKGYNYMSKKTKKKGK